MKVKAWGITALVCVSLIASLAGIKYFEFSSAMAYVNAMPEHSETVEAVNAEVKSYAKSIQVLGNTLVPNHVTLQNEVAGIVTKVSRQSGEHISKGDIIIQLDIATETANLKSAIAREKLAQSIYKRSQQLKARNAISQEAYDQAYADLVVVKAGIDVLKDSIRKKTIKAPFNGVLGIHSIKLGSYLDRNTPIVSMSGDEGYVWVDFYVPQFYQKLSVGESVDINIIDNSHASSIAVGHVIAIDDAVTAGIRSRKYRAKITTSGFSLDENTAVALDVPATKVQQVFVVPNISVLSDLGGHYVYVLESSSEGGALRAKRKNVDVISMGADQTMIRSGITENDLIAAPGAFKLFEGVLVNVIDKKTNTTPGQIASEE